MKSKYQRETLEALKEAQNPEFLEKITDIDERFKQFAEEDEQDN